MIAGMQPMGYATGAGPTGAAQEYEFSEAHNAVIADTARYARLWGAISITAGVLVMLAGMTVVVIGAGLTTGLGGKASALMVSGLGVVLLPTAVVYFVGGVLYLRCGEALRQVVQTQGSDVTLLMQAVRSMKRAFMIEAIATMVSIAASLGLTVFNSIGNALVGGR